MCGIAGIINLKHKKPIAKSLQLMNNAMISRGPDDENYILFSENSATNFCGNDSVNKQLEHIKNAFGSNFLIGLGFRHLKIMDVSVQNQQPMFDETRNFCIVFNGEVYNYKEIKAELIGLGHQFTTNSDTEVVLKSYIQWQEKALQKFNGMFGFAIYNRLKNEFFCARDRVGIKPFYYSKTTEQFVFASSIKAILASKIVAPQINQSGLIENFKYGTTQRPQTPFKNIVALKPAHFLIINCNTQKITEQQYWQIPVNAQQENLSLNDAKEKLLFSIKKAINYRLIADVEVGTFLSGGIDSSLITALAALNKQKIKAFTLGFEKFSALNEVTQAQKTASKYNINHIITQAKAEDFINAVHTTTLAYEEPYHSIPVNYQLAKMVHHSNLKVALNGLGGDELFGGYDCYKKLALWKKIRPFSSLLGNTPPVNHTTKKLRQYSSFKNISEFYSNFYTYFSNNELQDLFKTSSAIPNSLLQYQKNIEFNNEFNALSFFNISSYIGNHQTRAVDKTGMTVSVEGRFPFLDHELIEASFKIPIKYKLKNTIQKYILKEIAKDFLPKEVMKMPKKGLTIPLKEWIFNDLSDFTNDTLNQLKKRHYFSSTAIDKIVKSKNKNKIWQLVSTELWMQHFID